MLIGVLALYLLTLALTIAGVAVFRRRKASIEVREIVPPHHPDARCVLCHAPLRPQPASSAELVWDLEKRIQGETMAVSQLLAQSTSESMVALYVGAQN
jgi:hypothetical protein